MTSDTRPSMHDVFVSYASADSSIADTVAATIERRGVRCWLAHRDIPAGSVWAAEITRAIREAQVILLIFSASSNLSAHVLREVDAASQSGRPVLPMRVDAAELSDGLRYYIGSCHWHDASKPPMEAHASSVADRIAALLHLPASASPGEVPAFARRAPREARGAVRWLGDPARRRRFGIACAGIGIAAAAVLALRSAPPGTSDARRGPSEGATPRGARPTDVASSVPVSEHQRREAERLGIPPAFENSQGMTFVLIPSGRFTMGSSAGDPDRRGNETPHDVTITHAFFLQTSEVTNRQFRERFPAHDSGTRDGRSLDLPDLPVVGVTWTEANVFLEWLIEKDGRSYRLPTEAEWEYACRAGTTTRYSFGDRIEDLPIFANFGDRSYGAGVRELTLEDRFPHASPVQSYPANPWGLHDMHGNVWEWCADWFSAYPDGRATDPIGVAPTPIPNTAGPPVPMRVLRGGAWDADPSKCRSAFRHAATPDDSEISVFGFRLAAAAPPRK